MSFSVVTRLQVVEAELVIAITARHMIASLILVTSDCALWAIDCSRFLLPLFEVFVLLGFTTLTTLVGRLTTGEAHLFATVRAGHKLAGFLPIWFSNVAITSRHRTPSQVRVQVNHCIRLKTFVLVDVSFVDTVPHILFFKRLIAAPLHATNTNHFALVDLIDEIVLEAEHAELMLAAETVKLVLRVVFVAKITRALIASIQTN